MGEKKWHSSAEFLEYDGAMGSLLEFGLVPGFQV
jgi:hypothetical protein